MNPEKRKYIITDTSVLINFLVIDQAQLLVEHPQYEFLLTDHVRAEVTQNYPDQYARLMAILSTGSIRQITVNTLAELEIFATLTLERRLGSGECAAIAAAVCRACGIAIDDKAAIKQLSRFYPGVQVETTQSLIVGLIRFGALDVTAADRFKEQWQDKHRFRLPFNSFQDIM